MSGLRWIALLVVCFAAACGSEEPGRHHEKAGGYSIVPPEGWQVREMPGLKHRVLVGPAADDFAPNINVVDERFDGELDEYVLKSFANLKLKFSGFEQVGGNDLQLDDGRRAVKMVVRHSQFGAPLEQTFYFVSGSGATKYVLTGSKRADDAREWDATFDTCVRTFRLE